MHTVEIILCNRCRGTGIIYHDDLVDYHKAIYHTTKIRCRECKGSGRLEKEMTTEIKAYVPEKWDKE